MHVTVRWDNPEQTILRYDFEAHWTLSDLDEKRKIGFQMIDEVSHQGPVGVLFVLPKRGVLPNNIITNALGQMRMRHSRTTVMAVVTLNPYVRIIHSAIIKVSKPTRDYFLIATTEDEGRALLLSKLEATKTPNN